MNLLIILTICQKKTSFLPTANIEYKKELKKFRTVVSEVLFSVDNPVNPICRVMTQYHNNEHRTGGEMEESCRNGKSSKLQRKY